ncbi:pentapeptide repeat-containing protein [Paenibacillus glacialis]|uniref:Pentapeptide repeat-containing protein n=1 Tax=Paenibacillus glacialis TaxID=494026 RepID=A0A168F7D0_9BACL|nr:pentapeptide repeat-containing protein [Paenibacillus glacialis]OAB35934.1 hypothetical protein PGLA_21125 [Paenibacillus glacialis]
MNREEILQEVTSSMLEPAIAEAISVLEAEFQTQKHQLIEGFIHSFREMCLQIQHMQDTGEKAPIGYIHYSLLRTSILQGKYTYLIEAYSEDWYGDEDECLNIYDASWAFKSFVPLQERLAQKLKMYFGLFNPGDSERLMLTYIPYYHQFIVAIARMAVCQAMELPEAQQIAKSDTFRVRIGEFKDISEDIYISDLKVGTLESVKRLQREECQLAYGALAGLTLQGHNLDNTEMRYADLRRSHLIECQIRGSILIGTRWGGSTLCSTDFSYSLISDADFSHCDLRGASFCHASGEDFNDPLYRSPGLQGISFAHANLEDTDFRGASLYGANFEGANLQGAVFIEEDIAKYRFTDEQLRSIMMPPHKKEGTI